MNDDRDALLAELEARRRENAELQGKVNAQPVGAVDALTAEELRKQAQAEAEASRLEMLQLRKLLAAAEAEAEAAKAEATELRLKYEV